MFKVLNYNKNIASDNTGALEIAPTQEITTDGMLFYTSCNNTCNNLVDGSSPSTTRNVEYATVENIPCLKIKGNGSYVQYPSNKFSSEVGGNNAKSMSAWVNVYELGGSNYYPRIVNLYSSNAQYRECGFQCDQGSTVADISINSSWSSGGTYVSPVELNRWYFLCWTFSNNTSIGYCKTGNNLEKRFETTVDLSNNSCTSFGFNCMPGNYLKCYLSSVRLYNRALLPSEIRVLSKEFKTE